MSRLLKNASRGQKSAVKFLYDEYKQKAYYLALCLLDDENAASRAVFASFKASQKEISLQNIETSQEFLCLWLKKTSLYCKNTTLKNDSKSFKIPAGKMFKIVGNISEWTPLVKYTYYLNILLGYEAEQISATLQMDIKVAQMVIDALKKYAEDNGENASNAVSCGKIVNGTDSCTACVPKELDEKIDSLITQLSIPYNDRKKKIGKISGICALIACFIIACIVGISVSSKLNKDDNVDEDESEEYSEDEESSVITEPVIELDDTLTYYADIVVEDYGTITVELDPDSAPVTVSNFINLAQNGFYDGLTFHRIIDEFMIQGGDPNGDGTGGSDDNIVGEFEDNGYENNISHTRGTISMARSSDNDSASSQFFIVQADSTYLDGSYAGFGYVTEGMDIVDAICQDAEPTDDNGTIEADEQPVITSISIRTEEKTAE